MRKTTILYFFLAAFALVSFKSNAQENYVLDTDFDAGLFVFGDYTNILLENNNEIMARGKFGTLGEDNFYSLIRLQPNGSRDYSFPKILHFGGGGGIIKFNDMYIHRKYLNQDCYKDFNGMPCTEDEWNLNIYNAPFSVSNLLPYGCMNINDSSVILFGAFKTDLQNPNRWQCIVKINNTGKVDTTFIKIELEPNLPTPLYIKKSSLGGYFLCGAGFQSVNGYTSPGIIKFTEEFEIDTTFKSPFESATVRPLNIDNYGRPWLGAIHANFDGFQDSTIYLMRLNYDGSIDTTFNSPVFQPISSDQLTYSYISITSLLSLETGYVIGGSFGKINGEVRHCLAQLTETGEVMSHEFLGDIIQSHYSGNFPPKFYTSYSPAIVYQLFLLPTGDILAGGNFNFEINGHYVHNLMRLKKQSVNVEDVPSQKDGVLVYPNPTKGKLTVSIPWHGGFANLNFIEISDINGRVVRKIKWKATSSEMDISGLKPGIYIFSFYAENEMVERKKVVIQH